MKAGEYDWKSIKSYVWARSSSSSKISTHTIAMVEHHPHLTILYPLLRILMGTQHLHWEAGLSAWHSSSSSCVLWLTSQPVSPSTSTSHKPDWNLSVLKFCVIPRTTTANQQSNQQSLQWRLLLLSHVVLNYLTHSSHPKKRSIKTTGANWW